MRRNQIVDGVKAQTEWWIDERLKKVKREKHDTMEVNPFMLPLVAALHGHSDFNEIAGFLLGGHFAIGHATGFGKLIDEKVLPRVFGTRKLDKALRRSGLYRASCFDNIDHIVVRGAEEVLLSLKASKWTIQLGQAVELNSSFHEIIRLHTAGQHAHRKVVIGVFYGHADRLTDKYQLVCGVSNGANHNVHDLTSFVSVLAGKEFWTWLGEHDDTQSWVLQGITDAIDSKSIELKEAQSLMRAYLESFTKQYDSFLSEENGIDWLAILNRTND